MSGLCGAELGVVIIHGMGDPDPAFAAPLIDGVWRSLGADASAVAFEACVWSDIVQASQNEIWRRLCSGPEEMRLLALRKWAVGTLGDPTAYLSGYQQRGRPVCQLVHERLADALGSVERQLAAPSSAPVVVLAHSLGGVVVTNYLWNLERAAGEVGTGAASTMHPGARDAARLPLGRTPVERLETLAGLVTFGCSIPLFLPPVLPYECVRFPRPGLAPHLRERARWLNVYDPFDILAYPLNNLWDEKHGTKIDDVALEVGIPGISETPLSHECYWTDRTFHALVAGELRRVLNAGRGATAKGEETDGEEQG